MRHRKKNNHLGRTSAHRGAMLSNMATSLIMHKRIFTTVAKAKALKKVVEPMITRSKEDTTHSRRIVFSTLQSKEAVTELFQNVSQKVGDRPGGYTRIIRTGNRLGDNASMCFIELVDFNESMLKVTEARRTRRTRRSRRGAGAGEATAETTQGAKKTEAQVEPLKPKTEKVETESAKPEAKQVDKAETEATKPNGEVVETAKAEPAKSETDTPEAVVSKEEPTVGDAAEKAETKATTDKEQDVNDEPKKEAE